MTEGELERAFPAGSRWVNKKNRRTYVVSGPVTLKMWPGCDLDETVLVQYRNDEGRSFARTPDQFAGKFTRVADRG